MKKTIIVEEEIVELNKEILDEVKNITGWKYDSKMNADEVNELIEDLIKAYEELKEQVEDNEEIISTYYKKRNGYELVGMKESDF